MPNGNEGGRPGVDAAQAAMDAFLGPPGTEQQGLDPEAQRAFAGAEQAAKRIGKPGLGQRFANRVSYLFGRRGRGEVPVPEETVPPPPPPPIQPQAEEASLLRNLPPRQEPAGTSEGVRTETRNAFEAVAAWFRQQCAEKTPPAPNLEVLARMATSFSNRLQGVKVLGQPLKEFAAGIGVGFVVRAGAKVALSGFGGLFVPAIAGGLAGGATAGLSQYFRERRAYKNFVQELGLASFAAEGIGSLAEKHQQLQTQLEGEQDRRRKEALSDQIRYLGVALKRESWAKEGQVMTAQDVLGTFFDSLDRSGSGIDFIKASEARQAAESAKLVDRKRLYRAIGKGAIIGAIGGALGGLLTDWVAGHFEAGAAAVPTETPTPTPEALAPTAPIEAAPTPLAEATVLPAPTPEGLAPVAPAIPELPATPPAVPIPADLARLPDIVDLPSGSNPWNETTKYLETVLGRTPTNAEILQVGRTLCQASNIAVPEWGIPGKTLATQLLPGSKLNFGASAVKTAITGIMNKGG